MITIYDDRFNQNEWFILLLLLLYIPVFLLPGRFSIYKSALFILFGVASAIFADHLVSVAPIDLYDVNDNSKYNFFDFLLYLSYGPFIYFIIYIFDIFKLKKYHLLFYVPAWSVFSVVMERIGDELGIYHYKNGYQIQYSFPIYLIYYSFLFVLYYIITSKKQ